MRANVVLRESQWTSEWCSSTVCSSPSAAQRLENSRVCKETYSASKSPLEPHLWPVRLGHFLIQPWLLRRWCTVQHILPMKCHFLWRKLQSLWRFQHSFRVQEGAYKTKIPPALHFDPQSAQTAEAARPLKHHHVNAALQWLCLTGEEFSVYWCQNNSYTLFHTCQLLKAILNPLQVCMAISSGQSEEQFDRSILKLAHQLWLIFQLMSVGLRGIWDKVQSIQQVCLLSGCGLCPSDAAAFTAS